MDYRYLLFFERAARLDVLEQLGTMAAVSDLEHQSLLVLPDRVVTLPFAGWMQTGARIPWDDPSPTWDFMTVLCFEPDDAIEGYLDRLDHRFGSERLDGRDDRHHDEQGRAEIGYVYLRVHNDMSNWPSETGDDLVLFEFGTPGSSMSVLFTESDSIRRTFVRLLQTARGVYGVLDMEDPADLFWLRGEEVAERLPTAEMSLAEIERFIGRRPD